MINFKKLIKSFLVKEKPIRLREIILNEDNTLRSNKIVKYFKSEDDLNRYLDKLKKDYKNNKDKYFVIEEKQ